MESTEASRLSNSIVMRVIPSETNATGELSFKGSKRSVPLALTRGRKRERGKLRDLLTEFEQSCRLHPDEVAIYQRDLSSKAGESRYFALKYRELAAEYEAWFSRLRSTGIGEQDKVLVALPRGLSWLAASYALLRIGCEICFVGDSPSDFEAARSFKATAAIGVSRTLKKLAKRLPGSVHLVEVGNPLERIGHDLDGAAKPFGPPRRTKYSISYLKQGGEGRSTLVRLDSLQLSKLSLGARLVLGDPEGQCGITKNLFYQLFFPCWRMTTAYLDDGYRHLRDGVYASRCREAIKDLAARVIVEKSEFWQEMLDDDSEPLKLDKAILLGSEHLSVKAIQSYLRRLPTSEVISVFETPEIPIAAFCDLRLVEDSLSEELDQRPIGWFLPGLSSSIVPPPHNRARSSDSSEVVPEMGTLQVGWLDGGANGKIRRGTLRSTPYLAFENDERCVWLCGDASEILNTSFGPYVPQKCEAVFRRHSKVKDASLFTLKSSGQKKAAILIVMDSEGLPKDAKDQARVKAELMRLGAECDDTKMVLDIYFSDKPAKVDKRTGNVDRVALSKKYSRFSLIKSIF